MVVVFLHIASELVDVGPVFPLGLCHCYLNIVYICIIIICPCQIVSKGVQDLTS